MMKMRDIIRQPDYHRLSHLLVDQLVLQNAKKMKMDWSWSYGFKFHGGGNGEVEVMEEVWEGGAEGVGEGWGYFCFIWSSRSQVNSGPRLAFYRTFTIGIRLCLSLLTSRSMISTGSSTKWRVGFTCISSKGTTRDSSAKHFLRFDTWKVSCMP
ncbi:hypothetical protein LXL04_018236 [Taraxacum kok-saghyz]